MKKTAGTAFFLTASVFVLVLAGACEEQQQVSGGKKSRLIAAENIKLKKQLELRDTEIENQKKLLAECRQEKEEIIEESKKRDATFLTFFTRENNQLKSQVEELKKKVEELKKQPSP